MNGLTKTKILVGSAVVVFIIAVICLMVFGREGKENSPADGNASPVSVENYDITGTWYSDREGGDTLSLDKDGAYTSSKWLTQGKYTFVGNKITLTDIFGDSKALILTSNDNVYTLQYGGAGAHTYYRSQEEVNAVQDAAAAADEEMQSMYSAALSQILTTGEWQDRFGATALFTEDSIAFKTAEGKTVDYTYQVVSFEVQSGNYYITINCKDTTNNKDYKNVAFNLIVGDDNTYTLKSNGYVSQEFLYEYTKTVEIDFTQLNGATGSATAQDIADANSTGDRTVVNEDGSIDRITRISRDDNPDYSEQMEVAYKAIEAAIYGTWKGTYEEYERADTVYWQFTFHKDGTYSFNDDSGKTETGTFVLGRNAEETTYISNITLTPKDGDAYTLNFTMAGNPITGLLFDGYGTEKSYPTFEKQ